MGKGASFSEKQDKEFTHKLSKDRLGVLDSIKAEWRIQS